MLCLLAVNIKGLSTVSRSKEVIPLLLQMLNTGKRNCLLVYPFRLAVSQYAIFIYFLCIKERIIGHMD